MSPYLLVLIATLVLSPFVVNLAQKQDKKTKSNLKLIFLVLLVSQILLGLLNYQALWLFLTISLLQILILTNKSSKTPVVFLNLANTIIFFLIMIRLDQKPISDPANLTGIAIAFIVLTGNVIGLLLINKEKVLKLKPFSRRGKLILSLLLTLAMTAVIGFSFWNKNAGNTAIAKVSALPEVSEYLRSVPSGRVVLDHEDRETNSYIIHVFEVVNNHTATFNWYSVDKATGSITKDF